MSFSICNTPHHHLTFGSSSKASRIPEYQNLIISPSTLVLILIIRSGDVHVHPGPNVNTNHTTQPVISDELHHFSKKGLHFIHLNIRSLLPKLDELILLATKTNAAVIGITESWLDDSVEDSEVEVCGYSILRHDRNRHGGGVCLYIRSDISFSPSIDLQTNNVETVWSEVLLPKTRPILTGICYRPPKQSDFVDLLELSFNEGHSFNEYILLGDFNTDILLPMNNFLVNALRNFEHAFGLKQLIVEPTRVYINKESAIDLILVSDPEKYVSQEFFGNK